MKRTKLNQISIIPGMLEATSPTAPTGAIHASLTREYVVQDAKGNDTDEVYTRDSGDASITRADLVARAAALFADCAAHLAEQNGMPIKASAKADVPAIMPALRAVRD